MGRLLGNLKDFSAADLGGLAIRAALERAGVGPSQVQYVVMGQVLLAGAGQIPARQAAHHHNGRQAPHDRAPAFDGRHTPPEGKPDAQQQAGEVARLAGRGGAGGGHMAQRAPAPAEDRHDPGQQDHAL